jgi:ATP-dependent Clp protease ATP-binding subunit ClpA
LRRELPLRYEFAVPKPDLDARRKALVVVAQSVGLDPDEIGRAALAADGMYLTELIAIAQTARRNPGETLVERIRLIQIGLRDDPWALIDKKTLVGLEDTLNAKIIGQRQAMRGISDMIMRAASPLSTAAFHDGDSTPRVRAIFAGPSGVGKTETAKQIAKALYGGEDKIFRIDLTEYDNDASVFRLIGSPPGYIGYENDGILTRAALENPARVFLFDELEQANGKVLSLFYQILSDGRLTDARGRTASFSLSALLFTSNLGSSGASGVAGNDDVCAKKQGYCAAIREFFKHKGMTPLYERFSDESVLVYSPLSFDARKKILAGQMNTENQRIARQGIAVEVKRAALEVLVSHLRDDVPNGHAIKTMLEHFYRAPLSRALMEHECARHIKVQRIREEDGIIFFEVEAHDERGNPA